MLGEWSGRRGSNSRHSAWKADALPTELLPQGRDLWAKMDSNHRSRKTTDLQSAPFGHSGIRPRNAVTPALRVQIYAIFLILQTHLAKFFFFFHFTKF